MKIPPSGTKERASLEQRFWTKVQKGRPDECWEWQASIAWNGYGRFNCTGYDNERAHRVALALRLDRELAAGEWALHRCDNRKCCNPDHLYAGDRAQNIRDAVNRSRLGKQAKGQQWTRGSGNGQAKLTEETVTRIRREQGLNQRELSEKYNIAQSAVSQILNRRSWKHVP